MQNGLILFQSKYGAARRYAGWLAEATGFPLCPAKDVEKSALSGADPVILAGGIYASGVAGIQVLRKNRELLRGKRCAILAVGASPADPATIETVRKLNLKEDLAAVPFFYARGAWDLQKMSFADRTLCKMLQKSVAKKDPASLEPWEQALLEAAGGTADWTDREYLQPLLRWIRQGE